MAYEKTRGVRSKPLEKISGVGSRLDVITRLSPDAVTRFGSFIDSLFARSAEYLPTTKQVSGGKVGSKQVGIADEILRGVVGTIFGAEEGVDISGKLSDYQRRFYSYIDSIRNAKKTGYKSSYDEGVLRAYGSGDTFLDEQARNLAAGVPLREQLLREVGEAQDTASEKFNVLSKSDYGIGRAISQLTSANPLAAQYAQFYEFQNRQGIAARNARLRGEKNLRDLEAQREASGGIGRFTYNEKDLAYQNAMMELIAPKEARLRRLTEQFGSRDRAKKYVAEEAKREEKVEQENNKQLKQNNKLLGGILKMRSIVRGPFGSQMILGPYGTLAWNAVKGAKKLAYDLPIESAQAAMAIRTASESVGVSPMNAMAMAFATRAFGGNAQSSAGTLGGIAMTRQGALVGRGLGGLGEAALRYGLNISGSGDGGLATTNEILIRSAAIMQGMSDETKAAFAKTLGVDQATFQLLKKGPDETAKAITKAQSNSPYTSDYFAAMERVSESSARLAKARERISAGLAETLAPVATGANNFMSGILEWFSGTVDPFETVSDEEKMKRLGGSINKGWTTKFEDVAHSAAFLGVTHGLSPEAIQSWFDENKDYVGSWTADAALANMQNYQLSKLLEGTGAYQELTYDQSTKTYTYEIHVEGTDDPQAVADEIERRIREASAEQMPMQSVGSAMR